MKHPEQGDLRAWLDGELLPVAAVEVATHLDACAECTALRDEMSARASRVSSAMSSLAALDSADAVTPATAPAVFAARPAAVIAMPARSAWRWAIPVAALAAGLAIAVFLRPKPEAPSAVRMPILPQLNTGIRTVPTRTPVAPVAVAVARRRMPRVAPVAETQEPVRQMFLALDDEPIETGMVVRVSTESGDLQADVIVGPDGRAHAIRILNGGTHF